MTYAPKSLMDARSYIIHEFDVPANSVGIVGDSAHWGGYHVGNDRTVAGDYSVTESSRDGRGLTAAASALDIGAFHKANRNLRHFSTWLVDQCQRGAADTSNIREVIYSPDGNTVKRWDRLRLRSGGDDTHLWHTHISYFRDSESQDKTAVFRRYIEGDDMELSDKVSVPGWTRKNFTDLGKTISVQTALGSTYGHARSTKEYVLRLEKASKLREEAILKAVQGIDTDAILAAINTRATEDAQRDAALEALVEGYGDGTLQAAEVADRVVALIAGKLGSGE